jgi:hypothetical protein
MKPFIETDTTQKSGALFSSRALFLLVLLLSAFNQFSLVTADPDLWGHVKFGQDAWQQGALPETDSYSYTAKGARWINHEWLTEILFYQLYDTFGSRGILLFKMIIGWSLILLLARKVFKSGPDPHFSNLGPFLILLVLIPIIAPGFMPRPQLMTYLLWTLLLLALHSYFDNKSEEKTKASANNERKRKQNIALTSIPLIFLVWINSHGGVLAGLAILGTATLYEIIQSRNIRSPLLLSAIISGLATLINPYGYEIGNFFIHSLSQSRNISEWNGIPLWHPHQLPFKLYTLFYVILWLSAKEKWGWQTFIILPTIYFAYKHQRHVPLTAIAMTPFMMEQAKKWVQNWSESKRMQNTLNSIRRPAMACLLVFATSQLGIGYLKNADNQFNLLVDPGVYPIYAARFMDENELTGNIWNPFDWGEYLIWKLPKSNISVDGRFRTVYPESILTDSANFAAGNQGWEELLKEYPETDYVLVRKSDGTHLRMNQLKGWTAIYEDLISVLYIKSDDPENPQWKELNRKKLKQNLQTPSYYFP